jgi:DNA invertase Pin-like site-specific DNA recombinase
MANGGAGKLIGYIRVSTADQGENGHSMTGQRKRLQTAAQAQGYELLDVVAEVASGARERDGLKAAQERIEGGEAEGLIFPKLDRLGRSMIHLAKLVEWARDNGVTLLSSDEGPVVRGGEVLDNMLSLRIGFAQMERERISQRTKEGLAAAKARGVKLGAKAENVGPLAERATKLRRQGMTWQAIADRFNSEGLRTARGAIFRTQTIRRMIDRVDPEANPVGGYR